MPQMSLFGYQHCPQRKDPHGGSVLWAASPKINLMLDLKPDQYEYLYSYRYDLSCVRRKVQKPHCPYSLTYLYDNPCKGVPYWL